MIKPNNSTNLFIVKFSAIFNIFLYSFYKKPNLSLCIILFLLIKLKIFMHICLIGYGLTNLILAKQL